MSLCELKFNDHIMYIVMKSLWQTVLGSDEEYEHGDLIKMFKKVKMWQTTMTNGINIQGVFFVWLISYFTINVGLIP